MRRSQLLDKSRLVDADRPTNAQGRIRAKVEIRSGSNRQFAVRCLTSRQDQILPV